MGGKDGIQEPTGRGDGGRDEGFIVKVNVVREEAAGNSIYRELIGSLHWPSFSLLNYKRVATQFKFMLTLVDNHSIHTDQ